MLIAWIRIPFILSSLLPMLLGVGCSTSANQGMSYLGDWEIVEAEEKFRDFCNKNHENNSCMGLEFIRCSLESANGIGDCRTAGQRLADRSTSQDGKFNVLQLRASYALGCSKFIAKNKASVNPGQIFACQASLAAMDCFSGKLEVCAKINSSYVAASSLSNLNVIYAFGCERGMSAHCNLLWESDSTANKSMARNAINVGCGTNGFSDVCLVSEEVKKIDAESKRRQEEAAKKEKEQRDLANLKKQQELDESFAQEISEKKCKSDRYQNLSRMANAMSSYLKDTRSNVHLTTHEIFVLSDKTQTFQIRNIGRRHFIIPITYGPISSFSVKDKNGNEGTPIHSSSKDQDYVDMVYAYNIGTQMQFSQMAASLMMNPFDVGTISATGKGCAMIVVLSSW